MSNDFTLKQALEDTSSRHVLGLSGGKDSAALAIHIKDNYPKLHDKMEYFSPIPVQSLMRFMSF